MQNDKPLTSETLFQMVLDACNAVSRGMDPETAANIHAQRLDRRIEGMLQQSGARRYS